jgi:mediator of RNA polymerase II transcription subunit 31
MTSINNNNNNKNTTNEPDLPDNLKRFALELEFVQSLASPAYLHYLATQGYFQDPDFLNFLKYLKYWTRPEYAKYITYPHCLYFLELLTDPKRETFRKELANMPFRDFVHQQQFYNWQYRSRILYGHGSSSRNASDDCNDAAVTGGGPQHDDVSAEKDARAGG